MKASIKCMFALLLVAASLALPAVAQASIQLGAYTPGAPAQASALSEYASMVGRQPDIVMWYREFEQPLMYSNEIANLRATGQTPMVTWEPYEQSLSAIAAGNYDSYLHESAKIAKSWGGTLMIRFAHEMNGDWYPWGGQASAYVAAWRHIVSLFRADGASNVKWVWSPNVQEGSKDPIAPYFPGSEWVDYAGLDGYNWGTNNSGAWQSLQEVFAASYATVTQLTSSPVILTETASSEAGGEKAAWIRKGFMTTIPQDFPRVTAVVWFNRTQEDDWRIDSSQSSLEAYRAVVNCSIYGGAGPCEGAAEGSTSRKRKRNVLVRAVRVTGRISHEVSGDVSYGLSDSARVQIEIIPTKHPARRSRVVRRSHRGRNRVALERLVHSKTLRAGAYRVVVTARAGEGRSHRRQASFHVL